MSENPHGEGYWTAYQAAKSLSDEQLATSRRETGQALAEVLGQLQRLQGLDAGYADAQRERETS